MSRHLVKCVIAFAIVGLAIGVTLLDGDTLWSIVEILLFIPVFLVRFLTIMIKLCLAFLLSLLSDRSTVAQYYGDILGGLAQALGNFSIALYRAIV
jgi:hypothetical protein